MTYKPPELIDGNTKILYHYNKDGRGKVATDKSASDEIIGRILVAIKNANTNKEGKITRFDPKAYLVDSKKQIFKYAVYENHQLLSHILFYVIIRIYEKTRIKPKKIASNNCAFVYGKDFYIEFYRHSFRLSPDKVKIIYKHLH